mgnify:FL=1
MRTLRSNREKRQGKVFASEEVAQYMCIVDTEVKRQGRVALFEDVEGERVASTWLVLTPTHLLMFNDNSACSWVPTTTLTAKGMLYAKLYKDFPLNSTPKTFLEVAHISRRRNTPDTIPQHPHPRTKSGRAVPPLWMSKQSVGEEETVLYRMGVGSWKEGKAWTIALLKVGVLCQLIRDA